MAWEKVKIKDVWKGFYDGPHATPPVSDCGGIFLGISNITANGHIDLSDIKYISEQDLPKWTKRVVPQGGDIVFSYEATLNLYAIIPENFYGCLGRRMALIRVDEDKILNKFLYYYFFSNEWRATIAENTIVGATVDRIPIAKFPEFPISLPPLKEQKRIADILSAYDDLIENNQKQIKLLEEAAQRLYKQWFIDLRYPGHETTKIVDGLPEGWWTVQIQDVCKNIGAGGTPSRSQKNFWENGNIDWFKTQELCDCWLFEASEKISEEGLKRSAAKMFPANSILMAIYASPTLGRLGILTKEACSNQAALCLQVDESKVSNYWLYLKLFELRDRFNSIARGAGQQNISGIIVKETEITLPAYSVMENFTEMVKPFFEKQRNLQLQNNSLTKTRDRLLPKLMNGELEV